MQGRCVTNVQAMWWWRGRIFMLSYVEYISFQLFRFFDFSAPLTSAAIREWCVQFIVSVGETGTVLKIGRKEQQTTRRLYADRRS